MISFKIRVATKSNSIAIYIFNKPHGLLVVIILKDYFITKEHRKRDVKVIFEDEEFII